MLKLILLNYFVINYKRTGHFIVAKIAYDILKEKNPILLQKIENDLKEFSNYTKEKNHPFIECASWFDDIKYLKFDSFNSWHFYNNPYFQEKVKTENLKKNQFKYKITNSIWAIKQSFKTLQNQKEAKVKAIFGKSFMLRFLIHIVGDIHQPLHNIELINNNFKNGDLGGNLFKVKFQNKTNNLHSLFDDILNIYKPINSPMNSKQYSYLNEITQQLINEYPQNFFQNKLNNLKILDWVKENYEIAKKYIYKDIKENEELPKEYIDQNSIILQKLLTLGGYRLAILLEKHYQPVKKIHIQEE